MNTNTSLRSVPHKHAECIKAWADGAEIEVRSDDYDTWESIEMPTWFNCLEYRIKPQPVITKKYTFYDRIEKYVSQGKSLNTMSPQMWYSEHEGFANMLEWTFTDGKLTSITILGGK
jgi:hypothetical protein